MHPLLFFQRLPAWLRRHKVLRVLCCVCGGENVQLVCVNGSFCAYIDVRDGFARLVAIEDEFESRFFAIAQSLLNKPNPVFFDVGANYGLMSLGLAKLCCDSYRAHIFEPNPHLCSIIDRSIAKNEPEKFVLVNKAVMDSPGDVYLSFDLTHTGAGYVSKQDGAVPVRSITLDDYVKMAGITCVDLMKIDVEGNESVVLAGMSDSLQRQMIRAVYFEYCPEHLRRSGAQVDPIAIMDSFNYQTFVIDEQIIRSSGGPTHSMVTSTGGLPLAEVRGPLNVRITDLLSLPRGVAVSLQSS